ncbi:hypothetical protein SNE40_008541 [Patella caerulea]|uniref:Glutathione transferase n=1 Tax=Patella caerulea TaxID=87958 RepID=A0AAN8K219_PATCE
MPAFRLHYFDSRGRAEIARLMFNAAGQEFDDVRYSKEEWPAFKPKTPLGQLPVLEVDGELYAESGAIFNYLARELGFYGNGNIEALQIDIVIGIAKDFYPNLLKVFYTQEEQAKKELIQKLVTEDATQFFTKYEQLLKDNGSSYFVGNGLTLADIVVYDVIEYLLPLRADILEPFPLLQANRKTVESNPRIAAYLKTRK